jgi:hypothetical protein
MKGRWSPCRRPQVEEADQTLGCESAPIDELAALIEVPESTLPWAS